MNEDPLLVASEAGGSPGLKSPRSARQVFARVSVLFNLGEAFGDDVLMEKKMKIMVNMVMREVMVMDIAHMDFCQAWGVLLLVTINLLNINC